LLLKGFIVTTGTVKWFNSTKGFGFIQPYDGGADAFVHISAVERAGMREIVEGQRIGYDMERDDKSGKMSACNLHQDKINDPNEWEIPPAGGDCLWQNSN
jgi:CspA family cold shock protein